MKIVYFITDEGELEELRPLLSELPVLTLPVPCENWNRDLSPWPAEKAFAGGEDFSGGADAFLQKLTERILPEYEAARGLRDPERYIAGYSLAGLFAVYAAVRTGLFRGFASMSGSLWYDGFTEYLEQHPFNSAVRQAYFSLGDREKNARSSRMRRVEEATLRAAALAERQGIGTVLEMNPGGHFNDIPGRILRGIRRITE